MNEEELNIKEEKMFLYQILEEHVENDKKHFNPCQKCIRLGLQKGFQKGKLEQKKEELRFLLNIQNWFDTATGQAYEVNERIKQLQKEIGDDSQQPRMKQTRGGELKSDEGLHSTDNGSPADIVSKGFLGGYAEFWDNPEDDRWDKEYNPDLLPETLKNKEEKQDE